MKRCVHILILCFIFLFSLTSFSCPLFFPPGDGNLSFEVLWETPMYSVVSRNGHVLHDDVLYIQQGSGIIAVDANTGTKIWETVGADKVGPYSQLLVIDNYLVFVGMSLDEENDLCRHLWLMNRLDGSLVGRNKLVCPDFVPVADWDFFYYEDNWILSYNNKLILPVLRMATEGTFKFLGIYEFEFSVDSFSLDNDIDPIVMEPLYSLEPRRSAWTKPIIDGNLMYTYVGGHGWRGPLPPGGDREDQRYYYQEDVKVVAINLDTKNTEWEAPMGILGDQSSTEHMILVNNILYIADYIGHAAVDVRDGSVVYENEENNRFGFMRGWRTYDDGILYYPMRDATLTAVRASDGKILWSHQPEEYIHNRESNPLIWGDRVYMVDPEGLRAYNKKTGKYYGLQESLGIPGNRIPGYIPFKDDIIYIPQTDKLVAVRLGSEK